MIRLKDAEIIAAGSMRDVYRHPDDPALLVKVVRPSVIDTRFGRGSPWYKLKRRRYRHLIAVLREVREQIAVHAEGGAHPRFLQRIVGFVETDLGMGLVVEAVRSRDGGYAPTVAELAHTGRIDGPVMQALDRFLDEVVASPAIVADLNPFNVVYCDAPPHAPHFVLIDGIGHKNLIPLERISSAINSWSKARKVARFRTMLAARIAAAGDPAGLVQGGRPGRRPVVR
jgi:hypothetical protein